MEGKEDVFVTMILALMFLMVVFGYASGRMASPIMAIFARWCRWLVISLSVASLLRLLEWSAYPYWVLATASFLGWFLIESFYNWLAIEALSRSQFPLFPRFVPNTRGNEWPNHKRFIALRDWLRFNGFKHTTGLVSEMGQEIAIRSSVFHSGDGAIRLQVLFLPHRSASLLDAYVLTSQMENEDRIMTDNFFLPFGGFYPESWFLERKPWTRSIATLLSRHKERLEAHGSPPIPFDDEVVDDLNRQQRTLEQVNIDMGFLFPQNQREAYGKITREGRYRIWLELWCLSYFGRPLGYH